jgi:hypothetical protein
MVAPLPAPTAAPVRILLHADIAIASRDLVGDPVGRALGSVSGEATAGSRVTVIATQEGSCRSPGRVTPRRPPPWRLRGSSEVGGPRALSRGFYTLQGDLRDDIPDAGATMPEPQKEWTLSRPSGLVERWAGSPRGGARMATTPIRSVATSSASVPKTRPWSGCALAPRSHRVQRHDLDPTSPLPKRQRELMPPNRRSENIAPTRFLTRTPSPSVAVSPR